MTANSNTSKGSIPERVAILETIVPDLKEHLGKLSQEVGNFGASLNTVMLRMGNVDTKLTALVDAANKKNDTVAVERSRWKDPMLYVSAVSVVVAIWAVVAH